MQESFGMENLTPKMYGESNTSVNIQMEKKRLVKKKKGKGKSKSKSKSPTSKLGRNNEGLIRKVSPNIDIKEKVINKVMKSKMVDTSLSYQKYASKKVTCQNL